MPPLSQRVIIYYHCLNQNSLVRVQQSFHVPLPSTHDLHSRNLPRLYIRHGSHGLLCHGKLLRWFPSTYVLHFHMLPSLCIHHGSHELFHHDRHVIPQHGHRGRGRLRLPQRCVRHYCLLNP